LRPWYVDAFEKRGFVAKRVGARVPPGACIDRFVFFPPDVVESEKLLT
jgi:hypothetical protein